MQGIPNEQNLPHLHAISFRRNLTIDNNTVVPRSTLAETSISSLTEELKETREKILAVLKLILNGDQLASHFTLFNLLSRPY